MTSIEEQNNIEETLKELPRRLCSEIQLFDLCELERCRFKDERFCTDPELLARFEAAADPEDCPKWHLDKDEEQDEDEQYSDECEDEDDEHNAFDDEDSSEQLDNDDW